MAIYKRPRSPYYYYEFVFAGKRIRESVKTTSRTVAKEAERVRRRELEQVLAGMPVERRDGRIRSVSDAVQAYMEMFGVNHRLKTATDVKGRLAHVSRLLGTVLLPDLSEKAIRRYIQTRLGEKVSGRTINMEVGELSRAVGRCWSVLWPKLRRLEERKDVGKALSPAEEDRLLAVVGSTKSELGQVFVRIALLTGMRYSEILGLTWSHVDLEKRVVTVGKSKTDAGTGRQIPMNGDLHAILAAHRDWFEAKFGHARPELFLFPYGSPKPVDPSKPATTMKTYWRTVRKRAELNCRFHDLRHTVATKLAEASVAESTMLALLGHMSRSMMERYSHIRLAAKREAVESLNSPPNLRGVPAKVPTLVQGEKVQ